MLACCALIVACSAPATEPTADLVIRNGRIYTEDPLRPWAKSVAVSRGRILAVGSDRDTAFLVGSETRVIDLQERLVLPGFHDVHAHPVSGGLSYSRCPLYQGNSPQEYQRLIADCLAKRPGTDWVFGVGWKPGVFAPDGVPHKRWLDAIAPDRPVAMESVGGHSLWVNSKALERAGITARTSDPPNGRIEREPGSGQPAGALQESATELVRRLIPPASSEELADALRYANRYFNSVGIVGWQDASVPIGSSDPERTMQTYMALQQRGELKGHVVLALLWDNTRGLEQLPELIAAAERLGTTGLEAKTVKVFLDGVLVQRTAALIEPYSDKPGYRGDLQIPMAVLTEAFAQLDAKGFQLHVHAIGDQAVRSALDAFQLARKRNGSKDRRHLIAHANLVTPEDQKRFADLGVIGVFQPLWARLDDYMRMTAVRVGPARMEYMYASGSLLRAGARIAFGSDWAVASANPLSGIEVALTRREPGETSGDMLVPQERITLEQAIRAYTIDAAHANHRDHESGSIEVGKSADLVVLDRDLFRIPVHDIAKTRVLATILGGEVVYDDMGLSPH